MQTDLTRYSTYVSMMAQAGLEPRDFDDWSCERDGYMLACAIDPERYGAQMTLDFERPKAPVERPKPMSSPNVTAQSDPKATWRQLHSQHQEHAFVRVPLAERRLKAATTAHANAVQSHEGAMSAVRNGALSHQAIVDRLAKEIQSKHLPAIAQAKAKLSRAQADMESIRQRKEALGAVNPRFNDLHFDHGAGRFNTTPEAQAAHRKAVIQNYRDQQITDRFQAGTLTEAECERYGLAYDLEHYVNRGFKSKPLQDTPGQQRLFDPQRAVTKTSGTWSAEEERKHPRAQGGKWGKKWEIQTEPAHDTPLFDDKDEPVTTVTAPKPTVKPQAAQITPDVDKMLSHILDVGGDDEDSDKLYFDLASDPTPENIKRAQDYLASKPVVDTGKDHLREWSIPSSEKGGLDAAEAEYERLKSGKPVPTSFDDVEGGADQQPEFKAGTPEADALEAVQSIENEFKAGGTPTQDHEQRAMQAVRDVAKKHGVSANELWAQVQYHPEGMARDIETPEDPDAAGTPSERGTAPRRRQKAVSPKQAAPLRSVAPKEAGHYAPKEAVGSKPAPDRELSDMELSDREFTQNYSDVSLDPTKATSRNIHRATGWIENYKRHLVRKHERGEITKDQLDLNYDAMTREREWYDHILRERGDLAGGGPYSDEDEHPMEKEERERLERENATKKRKTKAVPVENPVSPGREAGRKKFLAANPDGPKQFHDIPKTDHDEEPPAERHPWQMTQAEFAPFDYKQDRSLAEEERTLTRAKQAEEKRMGKRGKDARVPPAITSDLSGQSESRLDKIDARLAEIRKQRGALSQSQRSAEEKHQAAVEHAHKTGEKVPDDVMADYPHLKPERHTLALVPRQLILDQYAAGLIGDLELERYAMEVSAQI